MIGLKTGDRWKSWKCFHQISPLFTQCACPNWKINRKKYDQSLEMFEWKSASRCPKSFYFLFKQQTIRKRLNTIEFHTIKIPFSLLIWGRLRNTFFLLFFAKADVVLFDTYIALWLPFFQNLWFCDILRGIKRNHWEGKN